MANLSNINNKFLVTTGGNVGIGVTGPVVKLELQDTTHTTMKIRSGNNDNILFLQAIQGQDGRIGTETNNDLGFYTNGTDRLTISNTGNSTFAGNVTVSGNAVNSDVKITSAALALLQLIDTGLSKTYNIELGRSSTAGDLTFRSTSGEKVRFTEAGNVGINCTPSYKLQWSDGTRTGLLDTNIGAVVIGSVSNDALAFYTNLTEKMRITSSGNVGIGTTSPDSKLDVTGGDITINTTGTGFMNFKYSGNSIGSIQTDGLDIKINATSDLVLLPGSNVGIGTTLPTQKLDTPNIVIGGSSIAASYRANSTMMDNLGGVARFYSLGADTSTGGSYQFNSLSSNATAGAGTVMTIFNTGNVGIATAININKLDVGGNINVQGGNGSYLTFNNGDANIVINNNGSGRDLSFKTYSGSSNAERMRINKDGNVGIGTTSPSGKLNVFGTTGLPATSGTTFTGTMRLQVAGYGTTLDFGAVGPAVGSQWLQVTDVGNLAITYPLLLQPNGGNVGIGTTSPPSDHRLQIHNAGAAYSRFALTNSSTGVASGDGLIFQMETLNSIIKNQENGSLAFGTNGRETDLFIKSDGNVGIGTTNPNSYSNQNTLTINGPSTARIDFENSSNLRSSLFSTVSNTTLAVSTGFFTIDVGGSERMRITSGGNVGIGTTSPTVKLDVRTDNGVLIKGASGSTNGKLSFLPASGGRQYDFRNAGSSFVIHDASAGTDRMYFHYNGNLGIGTTSPYSLLDVDGAITNGSATNDSNISTSTTAFSQQDGGALHITWGLGGNAASGSTIVFTYAATSWKSWTLKYNFASTNGITQGVIGGYWNNSGGNQNSEDIDNLGCSAAVTHGGTGNQNIIVTFTFTALGTHPMANFVYMQAGGDGHPRADRVSIQGNNAV